MALNPVQQQMLLRMGAGLLGSAPTSGDRLRRGLLGAQQGMAFGQKMQDRQQREELAQKILERNRQQVPGAAVYNPASPQGVPHMGAQPAQMEGQNVGSPSGLLGHMPTQGDPTTRGLLAAEAARSGDIGGAGTMLGMGANEQPSPVRTAIAMGYDPRTPEGREVIKQLAGKGGVTVNTAPGWAPQGYFPRDPEDPSKGVEPIPGSPAEAKQKERAAKEKEREQKEEKEATFMAETFDVANSLLLPEEEGGLREGLISATGPVAQWTPTLRGSTATAEQRLNRLKSLLTKENLGLMSGVLSESDIKILEGIGASLELGQADESMMGEVGRIAAKMAIQTNRITELAPEAIQAIAQNPSLQDSLTEAQEKDLMQRMDELGM